MPASSLAGPEAKLLLGSLVLVVVLWGVTRLLRRLPIARFLPGAQGPIRVVTRTHLGAKESLCLIEVGPTSILLAITAQTIRTLHVWPQGVAVPPAREASSSGAKTAPDPGPVPGQLKNLQAWLGRRG
jgi:flagellar biogenesis protein FliO